jgi:hypothetical protein
VRAEKFQKKKAAIHLRLLLLGLFIVDIELCFIIYFCLVVGCAFCCGLV